MTTLRQYIDREMADKLLLCEKKFPPKTFSQFKKFVGLAFESGQDYVETTYYEAEDCARLKQKTGSGSYNLNGMWGIARAALIKNVGYHDYDLKNCHPEILYQHCLRNDIDCPNLTNYIVNVDSIRRKNDGYKHIILSFMNGGFGGKDWMNQVDFLKNLRLEIHNIYREHIIPRRRDWLKQLSDAADDKDLKNTLYKRFCSIWTQTKERECLTAIVEWAENNNIEIGTLIHDGCLIRRKLEDHELADLENSIYEKTGYRLTIIEKPLPELPVDIFSDMVIVIKDDAEGAELFLKKFEGKFIKCGSEYNILVGNKWELCDENSLLIYELVKMDLRKKGPVAPKPYSRERNGAQNIASLVRSMTRPTPDFVKQVNAQCRGYIFFKDLCWNFSRRKFMPYPKEVYPFHVIPRKAPTQRFLEYDSNPDHHHLTEVRKRVLNCFYEEDLYYPLFCVARAIAGYNSDKFAVIGTGARNSGKGTFQTVNEATFASYVSTSNPPMVKQSADQAASYRSVLSKGCDKSRINFTNETVTEISNGKVNKPVLDGTFLKSWMGGEALDARKMRENESTVHGNAVYFMNVNEVPDCSPRDAMSTVLKWDYPFVFDSVKTDQAREPDSNIKTWIKETDWVVDAYFYLVTREFRDIPARELPPPERFRKAATESFNFDCPFKLFEYYFTKTSDQSKFVLNQSIYHVFGKKLKKSNMDTLAWLKKYQGLKTKKTTVKIEDKFVKGSWFFGIETTQAYDDEFGDRVSSTTESNE